jgi:hypothetical protein
VREVGRLVGLGECVFGVWWEKECILCCRKEGDGAGDDYVVSRVD